MKPQREAHGEISSYASRCGFMPFKKTWPCFKPPLFLSLPLHSLQRICEQTNQQFSKRHRQLSILPSLQKHLADNSHFILLKSTRF